MTFTRPLLQYPHSAVPQMETGRPEDADTDPAALDQADRMIREDYPLMRSLLIARRGKLIFEQYYGEGGPAVLNDLRSATKGYTSVLAGIAIDRGDMPGIDTPVAEALKRHVPFLHSEHLPQVTLKHLLTMTSGFRWATGKKLGEPMIRQFHRSRRWGSYALSLPIDPDRIGSFQYRSPDSHLISMILSESAGTDAFSYALTHLFPALGIRHAAWTASPEGHSMGHVGLYLTSRDMVKFGLCLLNGGRYGETQVIPSGWLDEALSIQVGGYPAYGDYGYQFWIGTMNGQTYRLAHGHGGQQILLLPDLEAVIVYTADSKVARWKHPRRITETCLIPAMTGKTE